MASKSTHKIIALSLTLSPFGLALYLAVSPMFSLACTPLTHNHICIDQDPIAIVFGVHLPGCSINLTSVYVDGKTQGKHPTTISSPSHKLEISHGLRATSQKSTKYTPSIQFSIPLYPLYIYIHIYVYKYYLNSSLCPAIRPQNYTIYTIRTTFKTPDHKYPPSTPTHIHGKLRENFPIELLSQVTEDKIITQMGKCKHTVDVKYRFNHLMREKDNLRYSAKRIIDKDFEQISLNPSNPIHQTMMVLYQ